MCGYKEIINGAFGKVDVFSDKDYERLIVGVARKNITTKALDYETYVKTAKKLTSGMFIGYGKGIENVHYGSDDYYLLKDLRTNIYAFSGAKTYQQVRQLSSLLVNENEVRSYSEFRDKAREILVNYNENYLAAEYQTAISQGMAADKWQKYQDDKDIYHLLTYRTVGDNRVRPEHAMLDGITRPVEDKFWKLYFPPNGWGCRCDTDQEDDTSLVTDMRGFKHPEDVPDVFKMNAGMDRIVFSKKHPYFDVAPKDKPNAKKNWGLPIP